MLYFVARIKKGSAKIEALSSSMGWVDYMDEGFVWMMGKDQATQAVAAFEKFGCSGYRYVVWDS